MTITMGIYAIRNRRTLNQYVGKSIWIERRWQQHRRDCRRGCGSRRLQAAWNKHGPDAFEFIVLEVVADHDQLSARERHHYFTRNHAYCTAPPDGVGYRFSAQARATMSRSRRAMLANPPASIRAMWERQRGATPTEQQMAYWAHKRGTSWTARQRANNPPRSGDARTPAQKARDARLRGAPLTPRQYQALVLDRKGKMNRGLAKSAENRRGKTWTPAQRAAFEAERARGWSPKRGEAQRARRAQPPTEKELASWQRKREAAPTPAQLAYWERLKGCALSGAHRQALSAAHQAHPRRLTEDERAALQEARRRAWAEGRIQLTERQRAALEAGRAKQTAQQRQSAAPLVQLPLFALPGEGPSA